MNFLHINGFLRTLPKFSLAVFPLLPIQQGLPVPEFSSEDRASIVNYWQNPMRFEVRPPSDHVKNGIFQVRLTTDGSIWLLRYQRLGKAFIPPTQDAKQTDPTRQSWDTWVNAKIAYDRATALAQAQKFNALSGDGTNGYKIDPNAPNPGICPPDLAASTGAPPAFASATAIKEYKIHFDDIDILYQDHVVTRPKYAYYRFDQGVNSEGVPIGTMPSKELDDLFLKAGVDLATEHAFKAVSLLEGGFDAVNTYDTGYVSIGFIQCASLPDGGDSLGQLLLDYKSNDPSDFQTDFHQFGIDVTPDGFLDVLDPITGVEAQKSDANTIIINDPRLVAVFQRAGLQSEAFRVNQIRSAARQFYPANDQVSVETGTDPNAPVLTGKVSDIIKSEAGMATLLDRKINTGSLKPFQDVLQSIASEHKVTKFSDFQNYEREFVRKMKYRKDYLNSKDLTQPHS